MNKRNPKPKRSKPFTTSVNDDHIKALDELIAEDKMWPPSRSELASIAILYLRDSIKAGRVTLLEIYQTYAAAPVCATGRAR